jgi:hypothetical protein
MTIFALVLIVGFILVIIAIVELVVRRHDRTHGKAQVFVDGRPVKAQVDEQGHVTLAKPLQPGQVMQVRYQYTAEPDNVLRKNATKPCINCGEPVMTDVFGAPPTCINCQDQST